MTLKGAIALILRYFTEFDSFAGHYVTIIDDRPIVCRISSFTFDQNWPTLQRGLSAIAKLLVGVLATMLMVNRDYRWAHKLYVRLLTKSYGCLETVVGLYKLI